MNQRKDALDQFSPLTPALSPLRGEGDMRRFMGSFHLHLHAHSNPGTAREQPPSPPSEGGEGWGEVGVFNSRFMGSDLRFRMRVGTTNPNAQDQKRSTFNIELSTFNGSFG